MASTAHNQPMKPARTLMASDINPITRKGQLPYRTPRKTRNAAWTAAAIPPAPTSNNRIAPLLLEGPAHIPTAPKKTPRGRTSRRQKRHHQPFLELHRSFVLGGLFHVFNLQHIAVQSR